MDSNAESSASFHCKICDQSFSQRKQFIVHCDGLLHREREVTLQLAKDSESTLDVPSVLNYNFNTGEWHLQNSYDRCRSSNFPKEWKNDEIFESVFSIIKGPLHDQFERLSVNNAQKVDVADTKEDQHFLKNGKSSEAVCTKNNEHTSSSNKSLLTYDHIRSLGSIISNDPMRFDHDKMASFDEKMMQLTIGPSEKPSETIKSSHLNVSEDQIKTLAKADDVIGVSSPYFCEFCDTLDSKGREAHTATLLHCKLLLTLQLEFGIEEFQQLFGDVPFNIFIDGVEPPPPSYDAYLIRIYRCGVINNLECKACNIKAESLKAWFKHSMTPEHLKVMYLLLADLGREAFLAHYGDLPLQRDAILSKSVVNQVPSKPESKISSGKSDDCRHLVNFRVFDHSNTQGAVPQSASSTLHQSQSDNQTSGFKD